MSQMEMSALTLLSWEVMSALGCYFLVVEGDVLGVGSAVLGTGGGLMLEVMQVGLLVGVQRVLDGWALPPVLRACRPSSIT